MTWAVVAKKDFRDAIRSKTLWALSVLFVLFTAGFAYLYTLIQGMAPAQASASSEPTVIGLVGFITSAVLLLLPLIGLIVGYKSIVGEVESGKAKVLLSLPHTRRNVVIGKAVGRTGVLSVTVLVGFTAAILVVLAFYDSFAAMDYAVFTLLTVLIGAIFVCIGIGISASTKSTGIATAGVFGVFILFQFLWGLIPMGINYVLNGTFFVMGARPTWWQFFQGVEPQTAYVTILTSAIPDAGLPPVNPGESVFTSAEFAAVVLAFWVVAPLTLGYLRFRSTDL